MARLNARGRLVSSVGDGLVSIDGVVIGRGGAPCWEFADGRSVLYNGHDPDTGAWALLRYTVATGKTERVDEGGSFLAVSEGRWAVQGPFGLRANFAFMDGSVMSLCGTDGRGAVGPHGEIALCTDSSCAAVMVYGADGVMTLIPGVLYGLSILDQTTAVWTGGAMNYQLRPAVPMSRPIVVQLAGEDWLVGWADGVGLVAQVNGAHDGYVLGSDGTQFDYDARDVAGELVVAWSTSSAEAPGQNVIIPVDRSKPRQSLVPPVTFAFSHPVIVAPFKARGSGVPDLFALGTYAEAATPPPLAATERLLLGHDALADWTLPAGLRPWDIPFLEFYRVPSETLRESVDRWQRQARALLSQWPGAIGVIPMFYDQFRWTVAEVLEAIRPLADLVNLSPRIMVVAPFAFDRANGIVAHPELLAAFQALVQAAAIAGSPTLPQPTAALKPAPKPTPPPRPMPTPAPVPPPQPTSRFPAAHLRSSPMKVYLKLAGKYVGVDPSRPSVVYHDRAAGGAWEAVTLEPHGDGLFVATFEAAGKVLSVQPDGRLETRPAGTDGGYELLRATSQPEGLDILYREDGATGVLGVPMTIEAVQ